MSKDMTLDGDYIVNQHGETLAIIGTCETCDNPAGDREDWNAHGSLLAAAPHLLEALEYARGIVAMELGEKSAHLNPLDAAIAKAKGEQ